MGRRVDHARMEGERPTYDAAAERRVFLVRLAAWGTVLVMAVIAFNVRAGASDGPEQGANGEQRNGTTSQFEGIWAVVDGDRVRELGMNWDLECDNDTQIGSFHGTYHQRDLRFDGRSFRVEDESESPEDDDGWVAHIKAEVTGTTESDGTLSGRTEAVVRFQRGRERGAVCRSGAVRWTIP